MPVLILVVLLASIKLYFVWIHKRRGKIENPYCEGIGISFLLAVAYIVYLSRVFTGEAGLASIAIYPFVLIGFILFGAFIAKLYKSQYEEISAYEKYADQIKKGDDSREDD